MNDFEPYRNLEGESETNKKTGVFGKIFTGISSILLGGSNDDVDKDVLLSQAVLEKQKQSNTATILIVTGFVAVLIIAGVILVVKTKK